MLEGTEGVGKTTQLRHLAARTQAAGIPLVTVREPGGTPIGDEIRRLLLQTSLHIVPRAEALLFMASRAQLVDDVVRPALAQGRVVVADRFFLATYAYQVAGRGLEEEEVRRSNRFATDAVMPDLTLLLDLPEDEGLARVTSRGSHDRIERSGDDFHQRVGSAFRTFARPEWQRQHPECGQIELVNANGTEREVADRIWLALASRWPETFRPEVASQL